MKTKLHETKIDLIFFKIFKNKVLSLSFFYKSFSYKEVMIISRNNITTSKYNLNRLFIREFFYEKNIKEVLHIDLFHTYLIQIF